ncbi:MAG: DUF1684 domain-containing protein [Armatimonadetes bacterium]|nr:DUF1684 domain-containing protein [Armatimonadota bacterium]
MNLLPAAIALSILAVSAVDGDYSKQVQDWRAKREESLKRPTGWLSVAGLFWLSNGDNVIGSAKGSAVLLPYRVAPAMAGVLHLEGGVVTFRTESAAIFKINGKPAPESAVLQPDVSGKPDRVAVGDCVFGVIQRGKRTGIRLWDPQCDSRKNFTGLNWYPVTEAYRIKAKFTPYAKPKMVPITNVLGDTSDSPSMGTLTFKVDGKECSMEALDGGDGTFSLIFKDATSGNTTYGAGRFLDTDKPVDGYVTLDFNYAYNPPCAFTSFATCPLPPPANRLKVAIKAGEKAYHGHD